MRGSPTETRATGNGRCIKVDLPSARAIFRLTSVWLPAVSGMACGAMALARGARCTTFGGGDMAAAVAVAEAVTEAPAICGLAPGGVGDRPGEAAGGAGAATSPYAAGIRAPMAAMARAMRRMRLPFAVLSLLMVLMACSSWCGSGRNPRCSELLGTAFQSLDDIDLRPGRPLHHAVARDRAWCWRRYLGGDLGVEQAGLGGGFSVEGLVFDLVAQHQRERADAARQVELFRLVRRQFQGHGIDHLGLGVVAVRFLCDRQHEDE